MAASPDLAPEPTTKPESASQPELTSRQETLVPPEVPTRQDPAEKAPEVKAEATPKPEPAAKPAPPGKPDVLSKKEPLEKKEPAAKHGTAAKADVAEEMGRLRAALTEKIARLNGVPVAKPPSLSSDAASQAPVFPAVTTETPPPAEQVPPAPPPVCLAPVDTADWPGSGEFEERLSELRSLIASSQAAAEDTATLAEFYLAYGLGHEALATAVEAQQVEATPEARTRLIRDADIARLLKGEPVPAESILLAVPTGCERPDAPLWRALAAAAARDADGAARDAEAAANTLVRLPERLARGLVSRIVAGVGNNLNALRAMAGALRNTTDEIPEDEARRFLLQARIASLTGDTADYAAFLERASHDDMTVPGVIAKARLAPIRAAENGPTAARYEEILADSARTYRHDSLGQQAAEDYAELKLRRHDYAAALAIADESAGPHGTQSRESRGASLAVRILRILFVEPGPALPDPAERVALFLRYGGYATPGDKGDDIRLSAARLMLARHMPHPALDTLRQLSGITATTAEVARMRAEAEAYAGDPAKALELVRALPGETWAHRIAAEALHRMNQPLEAAHALDGASEFADRARRASLLFEGQAWKDAAAAYSDLIRDPALPEALRDDAGKRYALALAMDGGAPDVTAKKLSDSTRRLLTAVPTPAAVTKGSPTLTTLRDALDRARHIETLLGPATEHQGS